MIARIISNDNKNTSYTQGVCGRLLFLKRKCVVAGRVRQLLSKRLISKGFVRPPLAATALSKITYNRDAAPPLETSTTCWANATLAAFAASVSVSVTLGTACTRCIQDSARSHGNKRKARMLNPAAASPLQLQRRFDSKDHQQ